MSSYDPTDIRSQERAKSEQDQRSKLAKDTEESDLKWLASTKRGRRIVWRLLEQAGVFNPTFNSNALQMAFAEGNRNSGNRLLATVMSVSPEAFTQMLNESKADEDQRKRSDTND